jgi:hypothetical protein
MNMPKIGDIVYYMRYGSPGGEHMPEPSPAIVTKVLDDLGTCQLTVFNPTGMYFNSTPYSEKPLPGHWSHINAFSQPTFDCYNR